MRGIHFTVLVAGGVFILSSCSTLTIRNVDFGWPVESVLTVGTDNRVEDRRYSLLADLTLLAVQEFQDSAALKGTEIRVLRSSDGHYFVTGKRFKHVYVFSPGPSELSLVNAIEVSKTGLRDPAMNQRPPHVELLDGSGLRVKLTADELVEGENP